MASNESSEATTRIATSSEGRCDAESWADTRQDGLTPSDRIVLIVLAKVHDHQATMAPVRFHESWRKHAQKLRELAISLRAR
ncbi:hypothetical protein [Mesorhizobium sp. L-8-10]|uniref:hypothetical protein n=1 Tax=Mesorhizobium sp. L-8-10 TaxID=2744523 RepID=UPI00192781D5|nr:hypothetical protein [Mesorhizobium sp. L-8-10]